MLADLSPFPPLPPPSHHQSNFPPLQDGDHQFSQPPMTMGPAAVDFRAFYPYTPNEVKHRKRTTSTQLKTLEAIFKRDTKPNAALRNELAATLNMTARGVQVWFQNRRAKEKTKAAKLVTHSGKSEHDSSPSPDVESRRNDSILQTTFQHDETIMTGHESSPGRISPPQLHVITDSDVSYQSSPLVTPDDVNGHFMRRGSLPGDGYPSSEDSPLYPPLTGHLDPFGRRRSVDASLHRLASNPYAQLAKAKNGALHGSRPLKSHRAASYHRPSYVTDLSQTSVPHAAMHTRHSSMDSRNYRFSPHGIPSPSPSPLSSAYQHSVRASSLSDNSLYAYSTRPLCEPIPGPLPSPGFSFGAATSLASPYSGDSDRDSPDPYNGYAFRNEYEKDEQIYQPYSRYGSIASLTTNDSSEFYPESEPLHMADAVRRDSCTSIAGMLSGLDVGFDQDKISSIPDAASAQYQSQPLALAHSAELSYGMTPQPEQMLNGSVLDLHSGYGLNSESPLVEGASEPFFSPPNSYPSANTGYSLSYPAGDVYATDAQSLGLPEVYPTYSNDNSLSNGSDYTPYI